ncbi:MAG: cupin fold metalloprotein, WbuC family [Gammaproteobacteria bacterium]|nr:MAG: cupin fold metalloprotein, WbuC family [Gammaproteobacteria bacterium]
MKRIDLAALRALAAEAAASPRRRKNLNLHETLDDPIQRLCNAFEPGTYLRPHRHTAGGVWELFALLTGRAAMLTFDDAGRVTGRTELGAEANYVVEIAPATWHSLVSLAPGTVLFEVKRGPYRPTGEHDFASWAPKEGDARAGAFVTWMESAMPGARAPAPV